MGAVRHSKAFAVLVLVLVLIVVWYVGAILLNWGVVTDRLSRDGAQHSFTEIVLQTWSYARPVLPAPHQVAVDLWNTTFTILPSNKRSLLYHAWITLSATLLGFVAGTVLGVALAIFIVLNQAASRSLMPWIIASQTIPILAVAPVIVVLAYNFLTGQNPVAQLLHLDADAAQLVSKAAIATYLSFFPVVVGMVKGLRSPELLQFDLMRTYSATTSQTLWRLRWPTAEPTERRSQLDPPDRTGTRKGDRGRRRARRGRPVPLRLRVGCAPANGGRSRSSGRGRRRGPTDPSIGAHRRTPAACRRQE